MTSPAGQQTPRIRSVHRTTGSGETASILTGSDTAVGDVLVAIYAADWSTAAAIPAPTGTSGAWRYIAAADRGNNATHLKAYDRKVTAGGAQRVSIAAVSGVDLGLIVIVLDGTTIDPANWWDGWQQAVGAATRSHSAPSVTATGTTDLLITAHATSDSATSNKTVATYSPPPGMTSVLRLGNNPVAADSIASDEWLTLGVFTETRTAAGATGGRTANCSASRPFGTVAIAIRGAVAPVPTLVDGTPAQTRHRTPATADFVATGHTYDTERAAGHHHAPATDLHHEIITGPAGLRHRMASSGFDRTVAGELARQRHRAPQSVVDNMTGTPIRVRHTGQRGFIEFEALTALTEQRRVITTQPRKRLRFYAQEVQSRAWRSSDVGLAEDHITTRINGACEIGGKIAARELRDLGINDADLFIHAELDGTIRGSGILTRKDFAWGGPEIDIVANGVTSYPHGIRWEADWTLRGDTGIVGVAIDPLDVMRAIWAHLASYPDGRLGVVLSPAKSTVRIGEPEKQTATAVDSASTAAGTTGGVTATGTTTSSAAATAASTANTPATGAANTTTDGAEQTTGPYILKWWEDTDLGKIIDDLAKSTPFDYRELPYWADAQKSDVVQFVEYGFPRVGRDRTADGLVFAENENLAVAFAPVEHDDDAAGYITVLGKGEGTARIRGTYGVRVPGRLRRTKLVEKKDCSTTPMANAFARAEWPRSQGYISVDEVHLKPDHPNARYGAYLPGDDVPARLRVEGLGPQFLRHRVMALTLSKKGSELVAKTQRSDTFSYGSSAVAQ